MKHIFLKRPKSRNWGNAHAKKRRNGKPRTDWHERRIEGNQPASNGDYLFANCVVLAAAVFGPKSQAWAEDMLPAARQLDARRAQ